MANEVTNQIKYGITQGGIDYVTGEMKKKQEGGLIFPPGYSVQNAMQSAYLMLRELEDKDGNPALQKCTQESVIQSLMQMSTQGLNPIKKQCYFVAYGNKCKMVPSYFGTLAILNRVKNLKRQPVANVVHEGDILDLSVDSETGEMKILKHEIKLENMDNEIIAAYAIIVTDKEKIVEIMTKKQIEQAWAQGQSWKSAKKKGYESATHKNFGDEMAKKTVLNRAAKKLINATDDSSIMCDDAIESFNETSGNDKLNIVEENTRFEIEQKANSEEFVVENTETVIENAAESNEVVQEQHADDAAEDVPDWAR